MIETNPPVSLIFKNFSDNHNCNVIAEDILERVFFNENLQLPKIILAIGSVRSGTTASLRVYAEAGIKAYSQPIKSIFRHLSKGKPKLDCGWIIPNNEYIYVKETFGPFNAEESSLNVIGIIYCIFERYLKTKVPKNDLSSQALCLMRDKLHIVIMGRHPINSWLSNERIYHEFMRVVDEGERWYYDISLESLFENFIIAYQHVERLRVFAQRTNISLSHYVYEANLYPDIVANKLFERIGISVKPKTSGWTDKSILGVEGSNVIITPDHASQARAGIFNQVNHATGIRYCDGKDNTMPDNNIIKAITEAGLIDIYGSWVSESEKELGFNSKKIL